MMCIHVFCLVKGEGADFVCAVVPQVKLSTEPRPTNIELAEE
jgi:hypothetical protein